MQVHAHVSAKQEDAAHFQAAHRSFFAKGRQPTTKAIAGSDFFEWSASVMSNLGRHYADLAKSMVKSLPFGSHLAANGNSSVPADGGANVPVTPFCMIILVAFLIGQVYWFCTATAARTGRASSSGETPPRGAGGGGTCPPELKWYHIIVLMQLDMITVVSESAYTPSMPVMADQLGTTETAVGLSLQVNWFVSGFFAFALAASSDKYGRRVMILVALSCYVVGALLCAISPNVQCLIAARCVMGVGSCEGIGYAVLRDCFETEEDRSQYMTLLMMTSTAAFTISPVIGGLISVLVGWRMIFIVLGSLGLLAFWNVCVILPESCPAALRSQDSGSETEAEESIGTLATIKEVFGKSLTPLWLMISLWALMPVVMACASCLPFVLADAYDAGTTTISSGNASFAACSFLGSILSAVLMEATSCWRCIRGGMLGLGATGVAMLGLGLFKIPLTMVEAIAIPSTYVLFLCLCMGPFFAVVLQPFGEAAGGVNGLIIGVNGPLGAGIGLAMTWVEQNYGMYAWLVAVGAIAVFHQAVFWGLVGPNAEEDPIFQTAEEGKEKGEAAEEGEKEKEAASNWR